MEEIIDAARDDGIYELPAPLQYHGKNDKRRKTNDATTESRELRFPRTKYRPLTPILIEKLAIRWNA